MDPIDLRLKNAAGERTVATGFCNVTDAKVDNETGKVDILSFTAVQDRAGPSTRPTSKGRCRAARCRASAGH